MNFWGGTKKSQDKEKKKTKHDEQPEILEDMKTLVETVISQGEQIANLEQQMKIVQEQLLPAHKKIVDEMDDLRERMTEKESEIRRLRSRVILAESQLGIEESE